MLNEGRGVHSRMELDGLRLTIEVPAGGKRTGTSKDGKKWEQKVTASYGYILGTNSPDGEHLDCYVRRNPKKGAQVYVMHQRTPDGSKYDEDKVMLGYSSAQEAIKAFKAHCFKPTQQYGGMSEFNMEHFKVAAYQARRSKAMLSSEKNYNKFKDDGLLPSGIKSPIQVAQKVSESMDKPLIRYTNADAAESALYILQQNGFSAVLEGLDLILENEQTLDTFIDILDYQQLPAELLGDLNEAITEQALTEGALSDAVEDLKRELRPDSDPAVVARSIAQDYQLDANQLVSAFERNFGPIGEYAAKDQAARQARQDKEREAKFTAALTRGEAKVRKARAPRPKGPTMGEITNMVADAIGDQFPDGDYSDAFERVRRRLGVSQEAWYRKYDAIVKAFLKNYGGGAKTMDQYMANTWDENFADHPEMKGHRNPWRESVGEDTTDDVFFAQQVQEMRKLAGLKAETVVYQGTPVVHETKAVVVGIQENYRRTLKAHYFAKAFSKR